MRFRMNNMCFDNELRRRLNNVMEREKERERLAKHRRNVAAMVDFTSNLLSLVGRGNGVRHLPAAVSVAQNNDTYDKVLKRYNDSLKDYKGELAGALLRKRLEANKSVAGFGDNLQQCNSLRRGTTSLYGGKEGVNNVLNNSRTIKDKNYVFGKFR